MSAGVALLLGALALVAGLVALQASLTRARVGQAAASLGPLGDPEGKLVWFHGPSCAPCRAMHPAVRALGDRVIAVDVSEHLDLARAYGVMATPTTVRVHRGQIVDARAGLLRPPELAAMLAEPA